MNSIKSILKENISQMGLIENLSLPYICMVLGTALACGLLIYLVYKLFYRGAVYSENFGLLLIMTTLTVAFIIMTISSNIVLSLGIVGALSIVRFRTAVKDPLDVGFMFLCIAAGLTAGAGLFLIAGIGTVAICLVFMIFFYVEKGKTSYLLVIHYENKAEEAVKELVQSTKHKIKTIAKRDGEVEATYMITGKDADVLDELLSVEGVKDAVLMAYTGEGQY